jgi:hypothetical protein
MAPSSRLLACAARVCGLLSTAAVCAQPAPHQFAELGKFYLPKASSARVFASGDIDGDRDLDLVAAEVEVAILANDGAGKFTRRAVGLPVRYVTALALLDVEADGDLDLLVASDCGSAPEHLFLYLNDGRGGFTDVSSARLPTPFDPGGECLHALAADDVDGDGDVDVALGIGGNIQQGAQSRLYLNDGTGTFLDATATHLPRLHDATWAVAFDDVDRDGDLDLFLGNQPVLALPMIYWVNGSGADRLLLNDGSGRFAEAPAGRLPADDDFTNAIALLDVDGDGDRDAVFGVGRNQGYTIASAQDRLYLNDGAGTFSDVTATHFPVDADETSALAPADFDRDGDLDLVLAGGLAVQSRFYRNDGVGVFHSVPALPRGTGPAAAVAVLDADRDGDDDLAFGAGTCLLVLNDGEGRFVETQGAALPAWQGATRSAAFGDVDRDGDLDLFVGRSGSDDLLYRNDGTGRFAALEARFPRVGAATDAAVFADVDADGDLDLIASPGPRLWLNDGAGGFAEATATHLPAQVIAPTDFAVGDLDGDGDRDLVIAVASGGNRVYCNDGTGRFADATATQWPQSVRRRPGTKALALGDIDADGDLDLVLGNRGQDHLFVNDGSGVLTDMTSALLPANTDATQDIAFVDADADGDLDLLAARTGGDALYRNDGSGAFTDVTTVSLPPFATGSASAAAGDVDLDGDPDLVLLPSGGPHGARFLLNDGSGVFTEEPARAERISGSLLTPADVDADDDLDLLVTSGSGGSRIFVNRHRHLSAPLLARLGRTYQLVVDAQPGYGTAPHVAVPLLGTARARIPWPPFGTLGLAPKTLVALPPVAVPVATGSAVIELVIPDSPALLGRTLLGQALLLPESGTPHFTGVVADVIR